MEKAGLLSHTRPRPKKRNSNLVLKFGTWNIRTLLQAGAMISIAEEIEKYKMNVVALQEIRWKGNGLIKKTNYTLYYSGNNDRQGQNGVGFMVFNRTNKSIMGFEPVSDRICTMRVKGKFHNITFINVYAPTEDTDESIVDDFYDQLQAVCDKTPKYDIIITLGDFNAKLGKEVEFHGLFGKNSLHESTSNNGLRVAQYAAANSLKVVSTWFPRKNIHKGTWVIPGTNQTNQIDHVLVSKRWASDIEQVRTFRGASGDSDHYLVGVKMKQKLALILQGNTKITKKFNLGKFEDVNIKKQYQEELNKKLENINESHNIEEEWACIKQTILETAKEVIGQAPKAKNEEWFDDECRRAVEMKKQAKLKCLQRNTRSNKDDFNKKKTYAYRLCRKKKREALSKKIKEIGEHHNNNASKKFYKKVKGTQPDFNPKLNICKDKNGEVLTENGKVMERWREYFNDIFTRNAEQIEPIIYYTVEPEIKEPTYEEVTYVIMCLKNHKAAGSDGITAELLSNGGDALFHRIHQLIQMIWREERVPDEWTLGIIHPIYKKGDKLQCSNYRAITLLNVTYKILSGVLYNRIVLYAEEIMGEYQCGFRANRSTVDQLFTIRQIHEKVYEYNINLHNLYIDFKHVLTVLTGMPCSMTLK